MIHDEVEYRSEVARLAGLHRQLAEQRERLRHSGFDDKQVEQATQEMKSTCQQLQAEIVTYERRNAPTWVPALK